MKNLFSDFAAKAKCLLTPTLLLCLSIELAAGHDSSEITADAFLRTNCLELRMILAEHTARLLMEAGGHTVPALANATDLENARPFLMKCASELVQLRFSNQPLVALATNATLLEEDHIELKLIFPRPGAGSLRFEAPGLKALPTDQPYGVVLTIADVANKSFVGQKLLTPGDPSFEVKCAASPARTATNRVEGNAAGDAAVRKPQSSNEKF
jgi:hypothetical protein